MPTVCAQSLNQFPGNEHSGQNRVEAGVSFCPQRHFLAVGHVYAWLACTPAPPAMSLAPPQKERMDMAVTGVSIGRIHEARFLGFSVEYRDRHGRHVIIASHSKERKAAQFCHL